MIRRIGRCKKMNRPGNIVFCLCAALLLLDGVGRAETVLWLDNFESNTPIANSVWRIGSPTAGPAKNANGFRTYSGTNCASTQNYADNKDARLVFTNYNGNAFLVVPDASQFPRLRFWHWFNLENALGFVEISTNNGTNWNQISPTYENITSGGVWSRPSIDLSAFAGQSVQFAFRFYGGSPGNGLGWYVDDVAVVTGAPVLNDPESFESGEGDWSVADGTWEIGKPTTGPPTNAVGLRAHSGTNCAATVLVGNYANNVDSRLISPPFSIPTNSSAVLHFWHWYKFNNALGFVEISTDGVSWNQISPTYQNGNTGTNWINVSLDLSAYAGQTVQMAFRFASGGSGTAAGWYVDDVSFVETPILIASPVLKVVASTQPPVGSFQFTFSTTSNTTWQIQASTNLLSTNWLPILTNTAGSSGTIQFTDLLATNFPSRFYRAVSQ
jgi:bacillopeptidase F (M6 metalloprotease family)